MEYPSDYLPLLYYDNVAVSPQVVRLMRDIAGADHLILGSDYVFAGPSLPLAGNVQQAKLPPDEVSLICCGNAQRVFLGRG